MQKIPHEDNGGAGASAGDTPEGLDKGPNRIELRGGGWGGHIAYCAEFSLSRSWERDADGAVRNTYKGMRFDVFKTPELIFAQAAAILVMQGLNLSSFFQAQVRLEGVSGTILEGPFLLLRGSSSAPNDPPSRLTGVALVRMEFIPVDMTQPELLGKLLHFVS
jgi:hypothetical protein